MHILLLNQFYPPDPAPTGQFLADLAEELALRGHEVRVICSRKGYHGKRHRHPEAPHSPVQAAEAHDRVSRGIEVLRVTGLDLGWGTWIGRFMVYAGFFVAAAWAALTGPRPDVVICLTTPPYIGLVGLVMRWFRGIRLIHWVMDVYPDALVAHGMLEERSWLNRLLKRITAFMLRRAEQVWVLGPWMSKKIAPYLAGRLEQVVTIPLWSGRGQRPGDQVDPQEVAQMRAAYGLNGHLALMYSGNMGLGHDFDTLLDTVEEMSREGAPDPEGLELLFVGGGTRAGEVRGKVRERGIAQVFFHPYAPCERLGESLAVADVHIVSQLPAWQGIIVPSKFAGVMAAGKPVIFVGGEENEIACWIRESGAGFIIALGDVAAMERALEKLKKDPELRAEMGRNAQEFYYRVLCAEINLPRLADHVAELDPQRAAEVPRRGHASKC